jgi:hypothetical protein
MGWRGLDGRRRCVEILRLVRARYAGRGCEAGKVGGCTVQRYPVGEVLVGGRDGGVFFLFFWEGLTMVNEGRQATVKSR